MPCGENTVDGRLIHWSIAFGGISVLDSMVGVEML
jgi:hypothetical protein